MEDVLVVGGGVIGLSIALELAGHGVSVAVLDQADFGREASWAGAGILPPGNIAPLDSAEAQLRALSHALWPKWAHSLATESGINTGYSRCGGLEVRVSSLDPESLCPADPSLRGAGHVDQRHRDRLRAEMEIWRSESVAVQDLSPIDLAEIEPALSSDVVAAYRLPELGQVRNPRLIKALTAACALRGVRLCSGTPVIGFEADEQGRILSLRTPTESWHAGRYCVAGGAWSRTILASIGVDIAIEPVRGQIVLVSHLPRLFSHVIQVGPRYLVPRDDGRILIGATEEHVGFLKENTASAVSELIAFGTSLVPKLAGAKFERAWAGLRPGSADGNPYLGRVPSFDNLFVAAGHFRSGLQMSPGTARLLRQSILEQETDIPLDLFACDRSQIPVNPSL